MESFKSNFVTRLIKEHRGCLRSTRYKRAKRKGTVSQFQVLLEKKQREACKYQYILLRKATKMNMAPILIAALAMFAFAPICW